jgi:hypothetical protein
MAAEQPREGRKVRLEQQLRAWTGLQQSFEAQARDQHGMARVVDNDRALGIDQERQC